MAAFFLIIKLDDVPAGEVFQGHLNHTNGAFHDGAPGSNDGGGLLALQHGLRNFGGIGQIVDPRFDDFDTGDVQAFADLVCQLLIHFVKT